MIQSNFTFRGVVFCADCACCVTLFHLAHTESPRLVRIFLHGLWRLAASLWLQLALAVLLRIQTVSTLCRTPDLYVTCRKEAQPQPPLDTCGLVSCNESYWQAISAIAMCAPALYAVLRGTSNSRTYLHSGPHVKWLSAGTQLVIAGATPGKVGWSALAFFTWQPTNNPLAQYYQGYVRRGETERLCLTVGQEVLCA